MVSMELSSDFLQVSINVKELVEMSSDFLQAIRDLRMSHLWVSPKSD